MREIQAPNSINIPVNQFKVFLAGSIEMGAAEEWQVKVIKEMKDSNITFLNPRRSDWDSSWNQSINDKNFFEQVNWELKAMEYSNLIVMYFDPNTKSPITLMELGLNARSRKLIVCCPDGFWRKGNVDILCKKYGIRQVKTIEEIIQNLKGRKI